MVEDSVRNDFWRALMLPFFEPSFVEGQQRKGFHGTISICNVGRLVVGQSMCNAQKALSSNRQRFQGNLDCFLVQMFVTGSLSGDYAGNDVFAKSGDIVIRDTLRPAESQVTDSNTVTVIVPRCVMHHDIKHQLHGVVLRAEDPETRMLSEFLLGLEKRAEQFSPDAASQIESAFTDLFLASLLSSTQATHEVLSKHSCVLRDRVIHFICENLGDPDLGVSRLVEHFHVSRAHLYRAFKDDGGVVKAIQNYRLNAAYKVLSEPRYHYRSIEDIAFELGFSNTKQFGRAFRSRFEITPNAARRTRLSEEPLLQAHDPYAHFLNVSKRYT